MGCLVARSMDAAWHIIRRIRDKPEKYLPGILKGSEVIVDLGCGKGFYCMYLHKYALRLYCVDIDKQAVKLAEKLLKDANNVFFIVSDAAKTPIPSSSVDVVFMANAFHDMSDKKAVHREVLRILKPDGRVVVIDWKKEQGLLGPPLSIRMDKEDYLKQFKEFRLAMNFKPSPSHYGMVLQKRENILVKSSPASNRPN
jgi:ubiquinone/menaquinone biosynthesis C-methylase UbiE